MIEIYNQTKQKINQKLVKKITQEIFKNAIHLAKSVCQSMKPICQLDQKNAEISIIFVGEKKIKQINKKYRKINKVTDVLSFGLWKVVRPLAEQNYFGEIFICYLRIIKQAKIFKTNVSQEL
ncbi:rRNA maturation RNase YbeY [Candidatus Kuenenbacteria bacterium]|nr:rRNA maturation RNase YbeY [Candidatus Kuenenbacteria bacterium]